MLTMMKPNLEKIANEIREIAEVANKTDENGNQVNFVVYPNGMLIAEIKLAEGITPNEFIEKLPINWVKTNESR